MRYYLEAGENKHWIEINGRSCPQDIQVNGHTVTIQHWEQGNRFRTLVIDDKPYEIDLESKDDQLQVQVNGQSLTVRIRDERAEAITRLMGNKVTKVKNAGIIKAPMPGLIVKLQVAEGDQVKKGQGVVVIEAMKMENEITSPVDGVVKQCLAVAGKAVNKGETLLIMTEQAG